MRFVSLLIGLAGLVLATLMVSPAAIAQSAAPASPLDGPRPEHPPAGASVPVKGAQQRFARNQLGQVIALRDIDDPANPYAGQYTDWDRWHFEHYVPDINEDEKKHFLG